MTVTHADAVNEPILRHTGTGTTLPTTGDNALYYHRNQQYSIIGLTNAAGTLVERYSYTAYGTLGIYDASGTVRATSTYANRYTYTGREYDPDLNLYHFRARWYDPTTGGFSSRDPLGYLDGMSLSRGYFGESELDPCGRLRVADKKKDGHVYGKISDDPIGELAPGVERDIPLLLDRETLDFLMHYATGEGRRVVIPASDINALFNDAYIRKDFNYGKVMWNLADHACLACDGPKTLQTTGSFLMVVGTYGGRVGNTITSMLTDRFHCYGGTRIRVVHDGVITIECGCDPEQITKVTFNGTIDYFVDDKFANPGDIGGAYYEGPETEVSGCTPYKFTGNLCTQVNTTAHFACGAWPSEGVRDISECPRNRWGNPFVKADPPADKPSDLPFGLQLIVLDSFYFIRNSRT